MNHPAAPLPGMEDLGPREQKVRYRTPGGGEIRVYFRDKHRFEIARASDGTIAYSATIDEGAVKRCYGQDPATRHQAAAHLGHWRRKCRALEDQP